MSHARIRAASVVAAIGVLGGLAACSVPQPHSADLPTPTPAATRLGSVTDDLWQMVRSRFPDAQRPAVQLIRFASPAEMPSLQVDCLHEEGFPDVTLTPDAGVVVKGIPAEQQEALAIAQYSCGVKYQIEPEYTDALTAVELSTLYDYYKDSLIPCLTSQGFSVVDVPSKSTFIDNYASTGWTPYVSVASASQQNWYDLNEACPQWPAGFWG